MGPDASPDSHLSSISFLNFEFLVQNTRAQLFKYRLKLSAL